MIIHNGDHAEFETENANVDPKDRTDWPLPSFDAIDWAQAFCQRFPAVPMDDAVAWFANALMRGHDEGAARTSEAGYARTRRFIGWLSGDIPQLHRIEVPVLADSFERFLVADRTADGTEERPVCDCKSWEACKAPLYRDCKRLTPTVTVSPENSTTAKGG